jgi:hypothetical protein
MLDELVQRLSDKTGLPPDKAREAVNVLVSHLKEKLPEPLAKGLDSLLTGQPIEGGSLMDKAKAAAAGLGDILGKKSE